LENAVIHISHQREQRLASAENVTWVSGLQTVNSNSSKKFPDPVSVWKKTSLYQEDLKLR